jgi:hypothetical protein
MRKLVAAFSLLFVSACAPNLAESPDDVELLIDSAVSTLRAEDGSFETTVAAIYDQEWIAFSFDTTKQVLADLENSRDWDLRFNRFNIRVNSGVSGIGEVEIAKIDTPDFEPITKAPSSGYFTDEADKNGDGNQDLIFRRENSDSVNGWFKYDLRFHTVTPAKVVYIVHAMNGTFYKLQFVGYYDKNGEGGFPRFRWTPIGSP